ncbi:MAG: EFR1 family ferrodoxin [Candidatus Methanomethylophilaceae archaeon]|nr:EFR1 family ferrodoxin [Candidatus Methanomethylophilaceae archaeon]
MIFCFSATGNSLCLAKRISEADGSAIIHMDRCLREGDLSFRVPSGENLGFVFPTYFSGIPMIVSDFLGKAEIDLDSGTYVYIAVTCGSSPGDAGGMAARILSRKGIETSGMFRAVMPHTWTPMHDLSDKSKVARTLSDAEPMISDAVEGITSRRRCPMPDATSRIMAKPLYAIYGMQKTKMFWVTDLCDGCGECKRICPIRAIKMENKRPVIVPDKCAMCLACLHRCPMFAIQYGKATIGHGRYCNPDSGL